MRSGSRSGQRVGAASGLYRPLFVSVLGILWNTIGHLPLWFRLFAVALHVVAAIGVFRLAALAVGAMPAAIGALWFAVQPVHIEAIASVANSSEILVALLALALASMVWRAGRSPHRELNWRWSLGAALLFGAACFTKESGVMLPALALAYAALWRRPPIEWREIKSDFAATRWWRAIAAFAVMLALVIAARVAVLGALVPTTIAAPGLIGLTFTQRLWSMLSLGPLALRVLLIPRVLNPHYGPSYIAGSSGPTSAAWLTIVVLIVVISAAIIVARKGDARFAAGVAWLLLAFLPASNLLSATGQVFAERTLYVSTIGSALVVAWIAERICVFAEQRRSVTRPVEVLAGVVAAIVLMIALNQTWIGLRPWRSHTALFTQMIVADDDSYRGRWLLGMDQRSRNQTGLGAHESLARIRALSERSAARRGLRGNLAVARPASSSGDGRVATDALARAPSQRRCAPALSRRGGSRVWRRLGARRGRATSCRNAKSNGRTVCRRRQAHTRRFNRGEGGLRPRARARAS